ncbi:ABC transporter substrate-binding protein [Kitasatospora herbaricolor]|uniref:ABC transporter substrate-binding protein n=1 Tax=Kitasatospora herbaricolor TaxID=68217 RepID=UPI00174C6662|nr:ABC transporter substrate-binding protein [Kitasatospora herbaricolor]MDQ0311959.1 peptide/nickel transport system substrate-binding protein [Kitasatospora herbaricolor]GGU97485.1 ABC transporter substrate-binding protein [Kitasatospora herbaricolor]
MNRRTHAALAAAIAATLTLALGACNTKATDSKDGTGAAGGSTKAPGAASGTIVGGTPVRGGTLTVLSNQDFAHLDPARNWTMPNMDFGIRLLYRTLVTFKAEPGAAGSELVPDLATDLGRPSDGGRTWTFTLKEGVKYEDGSPVRAADVKYNVERSFAPDLTGGPDYAAQYLDGTEGYKGPLTGQHLASVETPDERTIVFHLKRPVAEFSYTATLPTFSPVPQAQEKGAQYDLRPFSSGPYRIETYDRGKQLTLVRNTNWDQATDSVRKAYPDRIVFVQGLKGGQVDDRLIASEGADASAVEWPMMRPESAAKVLPKADVKSRLVAEMTGCTEMLYLNNAKAPFDDPKVREAMMYAVDKDAQVTSFGGPALTDIATSFLPPALTNGVRADPLRIAPVGDPAKAKELLAAAGKPDLKVSLTVSTGDKTRGEALQQSLAKAGIQVTINTADPSVYYDTIGDTRNAPDLSVTGWCPDYPSGATFLPFVFDGRTIKEKGNQGNYSQFRDQATMDRMDEIARMSDVKEANAAWLQLDQDLMKKSPAVPLLWQRRPLLVGTNVAGAFGHPVWTGMFDFATIGLKDPAKGQG